MIKTLTILLVTSLISFTSEAIDFKQAIENDSDKEIKINSDSLVVKNKANLAVFYNNVKVRQGGIKLDAEKIIIHTEDIGEGLEKKRIKLIDAKENISFNVIGKQVKADNAIYNLDTQKVQLTGNVELKEGGNTINSSDRIKGFKLPVPDVRILNGGKKVKRGAE